MLEDDSTILAAVQAGARPRRAQQGRSEPSRTSRRLRPALDLLVAGTLAGVLAKGMKGLL